jgi:hypothetical protein
MCKWFYVEADDTERAPCVVNYLHEGDSSEADGRCVVVLDNEELASVRSWPDVIGMKLSTNALFVSSRVHGALGSQSLGPMRSYPVVFARREFGEVEPLAPDAHAAIRGRSYFALFPAPGIRFSDAYYEALHHGRMTDLERGVNPESWSGADLFSVGGLKRAGSVACTRRFIELAREHRWTNFRFVPMELPRKWTLTWSVDYLGKKWPPDWRPTVTSDQSPEQWLQQALTSTTHEKWSASLEAFRELGLEALPVALREIESTDPRRRYYGAWIIGQIVEGGADVPADVKEHGQRIFANADHVNQRARD